MRAKLKRPKVDTWSITVFEQVLPCGCDGGCRLGRSRLDNRRRAPGPDLSLDLRPHLHPPGGVRAEEKSDTRGKLAINIRGYKLYLHSSPKELMNKPSADYGRRLQWVFASRTAPRTAVYFVARSLLEPEPMIYLYNIPIHGFKVLNKRVIRSANTNSLSESQTDTEVVNRYFILRWSCRSFKLVPSSPQTNLWPDYSSQELQCFGT